MNTQCGDDNSYSFNLEASMSYDHETGELSIFDQHIREVIEVRQQLVDAMLRQAIIIELEKLGYTVISPTKET